jgi:hypothetical protein
MNGRARRTVAFVLIAAFSPWCVLTGGAPQAAKDGRKPVPCEKSIEAAERIRVYSSKDEGIVWEFHQTEFVWELEESWLRVSERDCVGCEPNRFGPAAQLRIGNGNHRGYGTAMGAAIGLVVPGVLLALNDGNGGGEAPGSGAGWALIISSSVLTGAILGNIIGRVVPRWIRCEVR